MITMDLVLSDKWYDTDILNIDLYKVKNPIIDGVKVDGIFVFKVKGRKVISYGVYKGKYTEFKEFKSSDFKRSIPFEDSWEIPKRNGNTTLLSVEKRGLLLQNEAMCLPDARVKRIDFFSYRTTSYKNWRTLCPSDKDEV